MALPSLPQTLVPAVSFLAWFVVNWLKHSPLKPWQNALIALLVPMFAAIIWAACSGGFTQNLWGDIGLIVALSYAALALPELESWRQWLQDTFTSPFALWDSPAVAGSASITTTTVPPAPTPHGIDLQWPANPRQFYGNPVETMRSLPPIQTEHTTQPMRATTPETPAPATPVEESPAKS